MLLNMAFLMFPWVLQRFGHFGPFGHVGYFGPFAGRISPLLLFFGILFLFAIMRRGYGGSRRGGGYYRPQNRPPTYGPSGDVGRNPQNQGQGQGNYNPYGSYNPYAGPANSQGQGSQYNPYGPYGGYSAPGSYNTATPDNQNEQGAQTIRVDQMGNNTVQGAGTPTIRMGATPGTASMSTGSGQPTTPLRGQPAIPGGEYDSNRARIEQPGDGTDQGISA